MGYALILLSCLLVSVQGQMGGSGGCPQVKPMENFDINKFMGVWYESGRFTDNYENEGRCQYFKFSKAGNKMNVTKRQVNTKTAAAVTLFGSGTFDNTTKRMPINFSNGPQNYIVLNTDYRTFASLYSCIEVPFYHYEFGYGLSRQRLMFLNQVNNAKSPFEERKMKMADYTSVNQLECLFFS